MKKKKPRFIRFPKKKIRQDRELWEQYLYCSPREACEDQSLMSLIEPEMTLLYTQETTNLISTYKDIISNLNQSLNSPTNYDLVVDGEKFRYKTQRDQLEASKTDLSLWFIVGIRFLRSELLLIKIKDILKNRNEPEAQLAYLCDLPHWDFILIKKIEGK